MQISSSHWPESVQQKFSASVSAGLEAAHFHLVRGAQTDNRTAQHVPYVQTQVLSDWLKEIGRNWKYIPCLAMILPTCARTVFQ